nr:MAG TPA: hypothetical protein [Caudoviricetes sp.]
MLEWNCYVRLLSSSTGESNFLFQVLIERF